jgi:hypothetical protein
MHYLLFAVSLFTGPALSYYLGYSGGAFVLVATGSAILLYFVGIGIIFHFRPSTVQPKRSFGETGLNLTDKGRRGEDDHRDKN